MGTKKYIVRQGFVVMLAMQKNDGSSYDRVFDSGEEVSLDDDQAALHLHKLEFASQKDRDAALVAEKAAAEAAIKPPAEVMAMMSAFFAQAMAGAQAPAPAAPPAA